MKQCPICKKYTVVNGVCKPCTEQLCKPINFDQLKIESNIKEVITCPACFGCGYIDYGGEYENDECPVCDGTGKTEPF